MKITINEVVDFNTFYQKNKDKKFPFKVGYRLNCIYNQLKPTIEYYQETLRNTILEYSKKDEDGKPVFSEDGERIIIIPDKIQECNEKLEELSKVEVDIDFKPINADEIADSLGELSMQEIQAIMLFCE